MDPNVGENSVCVNSSQGLGPIHLLSAHSMLAPLNAGCWKKSQNLAQATGNMGSDPRASYSLLSYCLSPSHEKWVGENVPSSVLELDCAVAGQQLSAILVAT